MIDLMKAKYVLYDFDDTLCIHAFHKSINDIEYSKLTLLRGKHMWSGCSTSEHMKKFMDVCTDLGIKQGLISTAGSYTLMQAKWEWVKDSYNIELENFCVGSYAGKLDMMISIAKAFNVERDEILLIDDFWENIQRAADAGFQAATPMEVVNCVEKL